MADDGHDHRTARLGNGGEGKTAKSLEKGQRAGVSSHHSVVTGWWLDTHRLQHRGVRIRTGAWIKDGRALLPVQAPSGVGSPSPLFEKKKKEFGDAIAERRELGSVPGMSVLTHRGEEMANYCFHDVHVTGDEKLMNDIGRRVDAEWLWAAKEAFDDSDAVVTGQNVFFRYQTKGVRLSEVERIALEFPTARVHHMYQEPDGQLRGIAIYESGECTSLRELTGQPFETDDWMSFEDPV